MKKTTLKLGEPLRTEVREYCDKKGYTFTGLVKALIKEKMEREPLER